jgi:hypothetical protein
MSFEELMRNPFFWASVIVVALIGPAIVYFGVRMEKRLRK